MSHAEGVEPGASLSEARLLPMPSPGPYTCLSQAVNLSPKHQKVEIGLSLRPFIL
jgi:hypothetical protein